MKPADQPTVIILGGQPGSGKTELEKIAREELGGNVIACNADIFRDHHPQAEYIKANLEEQYPELTAPFAQRWSNGLREYCEANRFNYILETTFSSGALMNDTIQQLKDKGYRVEIKLLALHPSLSLLGTHFRFELAKAEEGSGRLVGKQAHDDRFYKIQPTLLAVELKGLFDKLQVYGRRADELALIATKPGKVTDAYREEIERDWTPQRAATFQTQIIQVAAMKVARNAPEQEVPEFLGEMNYSYGLTPTEKQVQQKVQRPENKPQRKGRGPRL